MDVKKKFGTTVKVEKEHILEIPEGLFGFEDYKYFAVIKSEYPPFMWMQSTQEMRLAFMIIDPFIVAPDYELDVDDKALSKIGITSPSDVHVMALVTVPSDGSPVTANLQGPLVINRTNQKCMQVILNNNKWSTKHDIAKALKENSAASKEDAESKKASSQNGGL